MNKKFKRLVIKIGSGIITKGHSPDFSFFKNLASQVLTLRKKGVEVVLVSSGAIACGMTDLKLQKRPQSIPEKQAVAALGQPLLMKFYDKAFEAQKLKTAQILITREDFKNKKHFQNAKHSILQLLKWGIVPVINENDSIGVDEIRFGDNDQLSAMVSILVEANLLVILTDIDGLYDKNPKLYGSAKRIPLIKKLTPEILKMAGHTDSEKSTGGMVTKLKAVSLAQKKKIPTWIVNGYHKNILEKITSGEDTGTFFEA